MAQDKKKSNVDSTGHGLQYYCKCELNGVTIFPQNIINLNFSEWVFDILPRLDMSFIDNGKFFDKYPIQENDIIKIEISKNQANENTVVIEFNVVDYAVQPADQGQSKNCVIDLTGVLKHKDMFYPIKSRCFSNKTSDQVFAQMATECGLKPELRIKCSDSMKWLQVTVSNFGMFDYVLDRSFKTTDDVNFVYTDRRSNCVYTSLNTVLNNPVKFKLSHNPGKVMDVDGVFDSAKDKRNRENGEIYFASYNFVNFSSSTNKQSSYGVDNSYWDLTNKKSIHLSKDSHPLTTFSYKEKQNIGKLVDADVIAYASDNQHKNHSLALTQNRFYKESFFSSCLYVFINATDQINLFDKVSIIIPSLDGSADVNEVHSGDYIIGGIYHQIGKNSIYKMMIALFRGGMNKSSEMKKSDYRLNGG